MQNRVGGDIVIDSILSLSFSIHSNKGVYALLLGSGVSRAARILTGWGILLDLVRQLAHLEKEDCEPDPAAWYKDKFEKEPNYSKLLDDLTRSPSERSQLLRRYFEPSEEERGKGIKLPTVAHKAIAQLVASEHIRVIVTTNFDRLMEGALEIVGIVPTVISTPDAVRGALPLVHTKCCVIKPNGDYLDTRIKNTPRELARYSKGMNDLLDRVFDEFALVVCGWSAEWGTALCRALERCQSHRFMTYWTVRGEAKKPAKGLIQLRRAQSIEIQDANSFFQDLAEKVSALSEFSRPHPLSPKVAVSTLKKHLVDEQSRIELRDFVNAETEKLYQKLDAEDLHTPSNTREFCKRVQRYESLTEILLAMMITGCFWGEKHHLDLWVETLERVSNFPVRERVLDIWLNLILYPALLLLYGGGIASVAAGRYSTLATLSTRPIFRDVVEEYSLILRIHDPPPAAEEYAEHLPGAGGSNISMSDHLFEVLREPLREFLPDDVKYERAFHRFEYLHALVFTDLYEKKHGKFKCRPVGRYLRTERLTPHRSVLKAVQIELGKYGHKWPILQAGLFDGNQTRFVVVKMEFDNWVKTLPGW